MKYPILMYFALRWLVREQITADRVQVPLSPHLLRRLSNNPFAVLGLQSRRTRIIFGREYLKPLLQVLLEMSGGYAPALGPAAKGLVRSFAGGTRYGRRCCGCRRSQAAAKKARNRRFCRSTVPRPI